MKDPIDYYLKRLKRDKLDIFYEGIRKIFIFVEDEGKKAFYKILLENLEVEDFECFDISNGKKGVIKKYFDNREKYINSPEKRYIFVLDKDYDNKCKHHNLERLEDHRFEELKKNEYFVIWRKYCIENYLMNFKLIKEVVELIRGREVNEQLYKESYMKLQDLVLKLSKYYYFNSYFNLNLEYNIYSHLAENKIELKNEEGIIETLSKGFEKIKECLVEMESEKKEVYSQFKEMNFDETLKKISESFNENEDIHGKEFIKGITNMNKILDLKAQTGLDLFTRLLVNNIIKYSEICDELKKELRIN